MTSHPLLHLRIDRLETVKGLVREVDAALRSAGRARAAALLKALRDLGDAGVPSLCAGAVAREGGRDGGEREKDERRCGEHLHGFTIRLQRKARS